jgi:hypothetical protein
VELGGLGVGGAGHARETLVELEVVLEFLPFTKVTGGFPCRTANLRVHGAEGFLILHQRFDGGLYNVVTLNATVEQIVNVIRTNVPDVTMEFVDRFG